MKEVFAQPSGANSRTAEDSKIKQRNNMMKEVAQSK